MESNGMTAADLVASIDVLDASLDYQVDQRLALIGDVDAFMAAVADVQPAFVLLPNFLPELRNVADGFMEDYRAVSASADVWRDLPYGAVIDAGDLNLKDHNPPELDGLPVNVPIALYRDRNVFHRVYCWGEATLETVHRELQRPLWVTDLNSRDFRKRLPDPGCDLHILPEAAHALSGSRATCIWPVQRGDFVIFLRTCSECVGALFQKYEIGRCKIELPWGIG